MRKFFGFLISIPLYILGAIFAVASIIVNILILLAILGVAVGIIWFLLSLFGVVAPP